MVVTLALLELLGITLVEMGVGSILSITLISIIVMIILRKNRLRMVKMLSIKITLRGTLYLLLILFNRKLSL